MDRFRDYLDSLCRSRGVQYAELARRVGVTKSYVGQLVHGHSKPPPRERCRQIADALDLAPDERRRLVDLAVRERAHDEARHKLEELDSEVDVLREAAGDLLHGLLDALPPNREELPPAAAQLLDEDELLAELYALAVRGQRTGLLARLEKLSPTRLAAELSALATAAGALPGSLEGGAAAPPPRPVPIIGHVAAGETDIAFTDAGLPQGASLPGEEPAPRWRGLGEHAYALRITGESMLPLCPPGAAIVVDPERSPRSGEPAICQTTEDKTYFKLAYFEAGGAVRLVSTNPEVAEDMVLARSRVRRLQKVVAVIYP
ncbi:MAG: LexA family transcriptional regulator [Candidatus Brocadiia bacterium]